MANLTHRAASAAADSSFTVASVNIGAPTGTAQNDLGVIFFTTGILAPTAAPTHTTPTGWTLAGTMTYTAASGALNARISTFYRVEPATPGTVSLVASANCAITAQREAADNVNTASPFDKISTGNGQTFSGTSATVTGFTTAENNELLIMFAQGSADPLTWTPDADFTERQDSTSGEMATWLFTTAGATGNQTATASTSNDGVVVMVAFRSEAAPTSFPFRRAHPMAHLLVR